MVEKLKKTACRKGHRKCAAALSAQKNCLQRSFVMQRGASVACGADSAGSAAKARAGLGLPLLLVAQPTPGHPNPEQFGSSG